MKYRIVKVANGYIVQYKLLFWHKLYESIYTYDKNAGGLSADVKNRIYLKQEDAKEAIKRDIQFPIKYRGHSIDIGIDSNNEIIYIDLNSRFKWFDWYYYKISYYTLDDVKNIIDTKENMKAKKKKDKKIFNIVEIIDSNTIEL